MPKDEPTCDLLLTGGVVITVDDDRRVLDPGAVAIDGERISAVGHPHDVEVKARRIVDCRGKVVSPGFVDCHNHLFQALARGIGDGMSLWPWLCEFMWPYSAAITPQQAAAAASIGALEAARSGTTAVLDNHYSPADPDTTMRVADAIDTLGLRGVVARGMFGPLTDVARGNGLTPSLFRYSLDEDVAITRECMEARGPDPRVGIWPAPINIIYVDQQLVHRAVALARDFGTGWHTHCSEAKADPAIYEKAYGIRPIDWLYEEELLDGTATLAHSIWLDDREVTRLGETGGSVSYNPVSNQYLASGVLRLRDLRAGGVTVGLGTDGPGCGHRQDMFEQLKQSILLQRVHMLDPEITSAEECFELATREGARYLGIDAGVVAPGKLADLIVVDLQAPHLRPLHRAVSTLTYSARGSDVVMTIVGGEVIYEDGRSTRVDEQAIMEEAQIRAEELAAEAGLASLQDPWIAR